MRLPALDPGAFGAAKIAGEQAAFRFDHEVDLPRFRGQLMVFASVLMIGESR